MTRPGTPISALGRITLPARGTLSGLSPRELRAEARRIGFGDEDIGKAGDKLLGMVAMRVEDIRNFWATHDKVAGLLERPVVVLHEDRKEAA